MADTPNSYKDAYWSDLASGIEDKLALPKGLLVAVVNHGERSNSDQVSEVGAKTPFQITPTTRKLVLERDGIDAYLSPQNAAEAAGLVLKDGMAWAKTKTQNPELVPRLAAGFYHGGGDQDNWGARTKSYIARVSDGLKVARDEALSNNFSKWMQDNPAQPAPGSIAAAMGAKPPVPANPNLDALSEGFGQYLAGSNPPAGSSAQADRAVPNFTQPPVVQEDPGLLEKIGAIHGAVKEAITGTQRATNETRTLPEWTGMPELSELSLAGAKTGLGTMFSGPAETAQIIKANYPSAQVRQDEKGNYIIRSSVDGKEYAIPPGVSLGDLPRIVGAIAAFTPAGKATTVAGSALGAAGTQAAIEGSQAATGGNFDADAVLGAGIGGGAVPIIGRAVNAAINPAKRLLGMTAEAPNPAAQAAEAAMGGAPEAVPAAQAALPQSSAPAASIEDVAQLTRKASSGGMAAKTAAQDLATQAAPNAKTAAAAERLGISDYLQSDHVTTNDAYRQVLGVLKSNPTSKLALMEKDGLTNVAQRASNLIDEVGGTTDLSALDAGVKNRMQSAHAELGARENGLYQQLREAIPADTEAPATSALDFAEQRAKDLGGIKNLTPMEKQIVSKLSPKTVSSTEAIPGNPLMPGAQTASKKTIQAVKQPSFTLLDDVRKDVGAAARAKGPFSDADTGLAKKYYGLLSEDQGAVAQQAGAGDIAAAAKAATVARKGMEDDLASLFGKHLDQSLVPQLSTAMKAAGNGDATKMLAVLKATPDDMKQEVVASGMQTVFRNAATRGDINFTGYAKWYDNLLRNKQAYNAVMTNLPGPARKQLSDLYRVSKGISDSLNTRIKTGLRSSVLDEMQAPDTLASKLFEVAKHAGKGVAVDVIGGHGAGLAVGLMSALNRNKTPALKAIDDLLTSNEFIQLAKNAGTPGESAAVRRFANSKEFSKYVRAVGHPQEMSNREKWVMQAIHQVNNRQR